MSVTIPYERLATCWAGIVWQEPTQRKGPSNQAGALRATLNREGHMERWHPARFQPKKSDYVKGNWKPIRIREGRTIPD